LLDLRWPGWQPVASTNRMYCLLSLSRSPTVLSRQIPQTARTTQQASLDILYVGYCACVYGCVLGVESTRASPQTHAPWYSTSSATRHQQLATESEELAVPGAVDRHQLCTLPVRHPVHLRRVPYREGRVCLHTRHPLTVKHATHAKWCILPGGSGECLYTHRLQERDGLQ